MVSAYEQRLEPAPTSVRTARRAVTDQLHTAVDAEQLDCLVLCTSELVTNAIEHGAPPIALRIAHNNGTVRIEVTDTSSAMPRPARPSLTSVRGRGLLIVERCSDGWGVEERPRGKTVWFELAL
jgi:anti-sigma regulatory factor (Ser/Thr protein kinase)